MIRAIEFVECVSANKLILINRAEIDLWMTALASEALELQRPVPDDAPIIVATGKKKDEGGLAA